MYDKPAIVQGDGSILLDLHHPQSEAARDLLLQFCELEKSPEHIHTYRISPLSLWNAASIGLQPADLHEHLKGLSRFELPENILVMIRNIMGRYGLLKLEEISADKGQESQLRLRAEMPALWWEIHSNRKVAKYLIGEEEGVSFLLSRLDRGVVKVELIRQGFPVIDLAGIQQGNPLDVKLRSPSLSGKAFEPRHYQESAVDSFLGDQGPGTSFGSIVLPCGAGKTIVGILAMQRLQTETLILTPNVTSLHQWMNEILDKTELSEDQLAEYSGNIKNIGPVTLATYQVITWRSRENDQFPHFDLFRKRKWGLIIYDEVHMLPAPVFRIVAEIQSVRRLGLTATLIREDGEEDAVFSLVGPKRFDMPWKDLENEGWIATAICNEIRIDLAPELLLEYAVAEPRRKIKLSAQNPLKETVVMDLLKKHQKDKILIIGQYIEQLQSIAKLVGAPLITGKTAQSTREKLYSQLRSGEINILVVSKVANFAIDLPDVNIAIQISGSFGSRQEEAQRLGRILRPKKNHAYFYSVVSRYTVDEDFSANRQKFLIEQGYSYQIMMYDAAEFMDT